MGLIQSTARGIASFLTNTREGGGNFITDTAEVFRVNAENEAERSQKYQSAALQQFAAEFAFERKGLFDRFVDGLNRLPRPMMAFGVIGLFASAMIDPLWFTARMVGLEMVPDPLWWLLGAIVSFYFGSRHREKGREAARSSEEMVHRAQIAQEQIKLLTYQPASQEEIDPYEGDATVDADEFQDIAEKRDSNAVLEELKQ